MSLERFIKKPEDFRSHEGDGLKPVVLLIGAQGVRTTCGLQGAAFALQRLEHQVWQVPTAMIPWPSSHGPSAAFVPQDTDFKRLIDDTINAPWLDQVGGIFTGCLASATQVHEVARLIQAVRGLNPSVTCLCDPALGGTEEEAVNPDLLRSLIEKLFPLADCVTPNREELAVLSGFSAETEQEAVAAARLLDVAHVVITSAPALRRNSMANILVEPGLATIIEHAQVPNAPKGAGTLLSALFYARWLDGAAPADALKKATASTFELVARSVKMAGDELLIPQNQGVLLQPMALINARRIVEAPARA
ncbi:bifunctional hydroxymethylpyrimidine kinase/phosphomethylpyrimidine kinase [Pseudovibrio exalbescens]|uniref:bifunctional hydroxymethylpyrimidine kinase/phosphomethylpyrimidine kinase n=1 Tax=Pseudovibrio exalbescens TaxID=197461 RepID=UPI002366EDCB|nr:bifunctional hydroxymethylpyrimidine kinase/phosphomethylpyrimidine kinase [Pseudovibrio exalbescens]MDD7909348.1 bifunctional hydroxymethylpyrimidine kinase/phosphomethylpyrimidine kinase [Pseudovibrio exalbescens]